MISIVNLFCVAASDNHTAIGDFIVITCSYNDYISMGDLCKQMMPEKQYHYDCIQSLMLGR